MECVCFTLIVDGIVLPHGETVMEVLGGGGPQTLFGYQLVTNQSAAVGLSAGIGPDLPRRCKDWLESIGADASGLVEHPRPTPRAWQVFEEWGRRTQIWRGRDDPCDQLYDMLRPKYDTMPPHFQHSTNYHLGVHPLYPPKRLMARLRQAAHAHGGALSVEPYTPAEELARPEPVSRLLELCDIFSPNEAEAESMVGAGPPEELAVRLLDLSPPGGADLVVIRCGPRGVLAARRCNPRSAAADGSGIHHTSSSSSSSSRNSSSKAAAAAAAEAEVEACLVPAVADTQVVDVTGCGNAFCGGFLAALYRHGCQQGGPTPGPASATELIARGTNAGTNTDIDAGTDGAGALIAPAATATAAAVDAGPAWLLSADLRRAGAWGCVAASFMAEERGVPLSRIADLQEKAQRRMEALLPRVRSVQLTRRASREPVATLSASLRVPYPTGRDVRPQARSTVSGTVLGRTL